MRGAVEAARPRRSAGTSHRAIHHRRDAGDRLQQLRQLALLVHAGGAGDPAAGLARAGGAVAALRGVDGREAALFHRPWRRSDAAVAQLSVLRIRRRGAHPLRHLPPAGAGQDREPECHLRDRRRHAGAGVRAGLDRRRRRVRERLLAERAGTVPRHLGVVRRAARRRIPGPAQRAAGRRHASGPRASWRCGRSWCCCRSSPTCSPATTTSAT